MKTMPTRHSCIVFFLALEARNELHIRFIRLLWFSSKKEAPSVCAGEDFFHDLHQGRIQRLI